MRNHYNLKCLLLSCLCLLGIFSASAQNSRITGKVTDSGSGTPLPGVNVVVKGTTSGTITDGEGAYALEAPSDATLLFSSIGYTSIEVAIGGRSVIDLQLQEDVKALDEIVVVGYGTQEKKNLVGAVASISSERIGGRPVASAEQALVGLTPGLNVAQPGASPGDLATINIRGIGSISAGYSPLFVIDGYPTDQRNFAAINPRDIESIEVLKDASATAIYGSRGANGVILVTTKAAKEGKSQITVGLTTGVANVPESARPELLNAAEYVQYYKESYTNRGLAIPSAITNWDGKTDTNWQDVVYRSAAFQDLNISASGGTDKVSYLISGNYINQDGVVIGEGQKKYSLRMKVDYRPSSKLTFGMMIAPNITNIKRSSPAPEDGNDWASANSLAYLLPPILPVTRPDGTYANGTDLGYGFPLANPLELQQEYQRTTDLFRMLANSYASLEITKGLVFRTSLGLNFSSDKNRLYYDAPGPRQSLPNVSTLQLGQSNEVGWLSESTLSYKRVFATDHSIDALVGYTAQKNNSDVLNASVSSLGVIGPHIAFVG
ncbi:MAG: SusC/RagA family TonB-linked outer membrane protein [Bacteroidota bacterium]